MDLRETRSRKEAIARHPWELARLEVMKDIYRKHSGSRTGTVMDLGCGDTFFVEQFSGEHPDNRYLAVDIAFDEETVRELSVKLNPRGIFLFHDLRSASASLQGRVHSVFLMDVIEHIEDDIRFLKELKQSGMIGAETCIYITVPAYKSLFCSHDRFLGHYRRYTNRMLKKHIEMAGYISVTEGYFFSTLLLPRTIQVLKEKVFGAKKETTGLVEWKGGPFITGMLKSILYFDYLVSRTLHATGIRLPGLSNYMVCKPAAS